MKGLGILSLAGVLASFGIGRTRRSTSLKDHSAIVPETARPIHKPNLSTPEVGRTIIGATINGSRRASDRRSYMADRRIARKRRNFEKRGGK